MLKKDEGLDDADSRRGKGHKWMKVLNTNGNKDLHIRFCDTMQEETTRATQRNVTRVFFDKGQNKSIGGAVLITGI